MRLRPAPLPPAASSLAPCVLAFFAFLSATVVAHADTTSSYGDFGGEGLQTLGGLAQSPEADLFTGNFTLAIPILIPPGRKNATPDLKLVYSSSGGDGPFGHGWSLPLGSIERSTKYGVPRCAQPGSLNDHTDDFVLSLRGGAHELVPVPGSSNTYRVEADDGFIDAVASPGQGQNNFWVVKDRAGMTYTFGGSSGARVRKQEGQFHDDDFYYYDGGQICAYTTVWALTSIEDPNGNRVDIAYEKLGSKATYPTSIAYGGGASQAHVFRVDFEKTPRSTPPSLSYRRGVKELWEHVVSEIHVFVDGDEKRTYRLDYSCSDTSRTLLCGVYDETQDVSPAERMPAQTFEYSTDDFAHHSCQALGLGPADCQDRYIPPQSNTPEQFRAVEETDGELYRTVMDLDGDGFLDLIAANEANNDWNVYHGSELGIATVAKPWKIPPGDPFLNGTVQKLHFEDEGEKVFTVRDAVDLTGDGIPDFVNGSKDEIEQGQMEWEMYEGYCEPSGNPSAPTRCGFRSTYVPWKGVPLFDGPESNGGRARLRFDHREGGGPNENGTSFNTRRRLVDFNGDGLLDLVDAHSGSGDHRHVYLNRGVDPVSGEGWFELAPDLEHASWGRAIHKEKNEAGFRLAFGDVFDFNGDGLVDVVVRDNGTGISEIKVNQGEGDFGALLDLPGIEVREIDKDTQRTYQEFVDMNGDGLPDHVLWDGTFTSSQGILRANWTVRLNTGTGLEATGRPWLGNSDGSIRRDSKGGRTRVDVLDWNGDGLADLVDATTPLATGGWTIRYGAPREAGEPWVRPGLLLRAFNGVGGVTEVEYTPSSRFDNTGGDEQSDLPFVTWVVTAVRKTDGLCTPDPGVDVFDRTQNDCIDAGHEIVKEIAYAGGRFDAESREFRGFRTVTEIDMAGNTRVVTFDQEDFTAGRIESDERYAGLLPGGKLVRRERFVWQTRASLSRTQVFLAEHRLAEYDPDGGGDADPNQQCLATANDAPDDYGRVTKTCSRGCTSSEPPVLPVPGNVCETNLELGQVNTVTHWADPDSSSWSVRERPDWVRVESWNGAGFVPLTAKHFLYDNLTTPARVTQGNVTLIRTTLDTDPGDADDPRVWMTYDPYGNVLTTKDPNGTTSESYYENGDLHGLYPDKEEAIQGSALHQVTQDWDIVVGKRTRVTDSNGATTRYAYDALGRLTCEAKPDDDCPAQPTAEYAYHWGDPAASSNEGKLSYVEVRRPKPAVYGGQTVERVYFDALGRKRLTTTERVIGATTTLQTVVVGHTFYDAVGRVRHVLADYVKTGDLGVDPASLAEATTYSYALNGSPTLSDPLGRVHEINPPDGRETRTFYRGVRTEVHDPAGHARKVFVDAFGRVTRKEHHEGTSNPRLWFEFEYDGLGRLLATTTSGQANTRTTQVYDSLGRVRQRTDPDSGVWSYDYDKNGNLTYQNDPKASQHAHWCYDGLNRPTLRCVYPNGDGPTPNPCATECGGAAFLDSKLEYDEPTVGKYRKGRLWRVTRGTGELDEEFDYDKRGRVKKSKKRVLGIETSTQFSYDTMDRLESITYPDGEEVVQTYYESGQLAADGVYFWDADYDRFGRLERLAHTNGVEDYLVYHGAAQDFRLQTLQTRRTSNGVNYLLQDYAYDPVGRIQTIDDRRSASLPTAIFNDATYLYDGLGRLEQVLGTMGSPTGQFNEAFDYDPIGNVESKDNPEITDAAIAYEGGPHQAQSHDDIADMDYDANGNRTEKELADGTKEVYEYDPLGRLTKISFPPTTQIVEFTYDFLDRRVSRTVAGGTPYRYFNRYAESANGLLTKYYYAGDRLVATFEDEDSQFSEVAPGAGPRPAPWILPAFAVYGVGGAVLALFLLPGRRFGPAGVPVPRTRALGTAIAVLVGTSPVLLAGRPRGGGSSTAVFRDYHFDHLGSLQAVTKEDGGLVYQVRYWAYGEIRGRFNGAGSPIAANPDYRYEFTGHETEFASELAYAGARFYDPEIAQFLTHDPAGEFASPYAYGPGNPVNGADPTGAQWAELESASSGGGSAETDASGGDSGESVGGGNVGGGAKKTQAPVEQKSPPPTKTSEKAAEHTGDGLAAGSGGKGAAAAAKGVSERAAHGSGDVRDVVNGESSQQTKFDRFFETHYDAAAVMAAEYGFDATLALAVAAKESDWGTSPMAVEHNNPFGFTPGGQGSRPVHFDSVSEAWQAWGKQWGPRVAYVGSNVERFVSSLQADNRFVYGPTIGGDRRGRYNTESMDTWGPSMPAIIRSVQTRLHQWSGYGP